MKLYTGNGAPVELEGRTRRIQLGRRAVDAAEDVELIVMQVDRDRVVGLIRRPLRAEACDAAEKKQERGEAEAAADVPYRRIRAS